MYGVFHGRRILWGCVIGIGCLLLPFLSGMVAKEAAAQVEKTQPVSAVAEFWETVVSLL